MATLLLICSAIWAADREAAFFIGGRNPNGPFAGNSGPRTPATVGEAVLRIPDRKLEHFYHQFSVGFWRRKEFPPGTGVIIVPGAEPPLVTSYWSAYSIGLRSPGPFYVILSHGVGWIDRPTAYLGTRYQFFTMLGFGYAGQKITGECGFRHISNGSRYTGTTEVNAGEDFLLCGMAFTF